MDQQQTNQDEEILIIQEINKESDEQEINYLIGRLKLRCNFLSGEVQKTFCPKYQNLKHLEVYITVFNEQNSLVNKKSYFFFCQDHFEILKKEGQSQEFFYKNILPYYNPITLRPVINYQKQAFNHSQVMQFAQDNSDLQKNNILVPEQMQLCCINLWQQYQNLKIYRQALSFQSKEEIKNQLINEKIQQLYDLKFQYEKINKTTTPTLQQMLYLCHFFKKPSKIIDNSIYRTSRIHPYNPN